MYFNDVIDEKLTKNSQENIEKVPKLNFKVFQQFEERNNNKMPTILNQNQKKVFNLINQNKNFKTNVYKQLNLMNNNDNNNNNNNNNNF